MLDLACLRRRAALVAVVAPLVACGGSEFSTGTTSETSSTTTGGGGAPSSTSASVGGGTAESSTGATTGEGGSGGCDADLDVDNHNCGACGHDCLGGACSGGACQPVVLDPTEQPAYDLAIDDKYVFWTVPGTESAGKSNNDGAVKRADLDGGHPTTMATVQASPIMLALTPDLVVWTDSGGSLSTAAGLVMSTGKSGPCDTNCNVISKGDDRPFGIATGNGRIYWTDFGAPGASQAGSLHAFDGQNLSLVVGGLADPTILAFDSNVLYFSEPYGSRVLAYNLITAPAAPLDVATNQFGADGVVIEGDQLYFVNYASGILYRVGTNGAGLTQLATNLDHPALVVLDEAYAYWTAIGSGNSDGVVQRMKKDCTGNGCVETLAVGQCKPTGIAVDAGAVYWTNAAAGSFGCQAGAVMKVAK